jgi:hypothetical protein
MANVIATMSCNVNCANGILQLVRGSGESGEIPFFHTRLAKPGYMAMYDVVKSCCSILCIWTYQIWHTHVRVLR